ncbi:phage portal protein [Novosphingobium colocasiae]
MTQTSTSALPATVEQVEADAVTHPGQIFSFGDPESVLDRREITQYFEIWHNNRWYEPPLPMGKLAQAFNMAPYHRSAVGLKVNMLVTQQVPSRWLAAVDFERFALDFIQMGNSYLEAVLNFAGRLARAEHSPAVHTRAGVEPGVYWFVNGPIGDTHQYAAGQVFHLQQPDVAQEIYGMPEWLAALQSGLLSENATLFRRRYYLNGAHAGFILYVSEPLADNETVDAIQTQLGRSKGVGNFKNLFMYVPNGKKDGVQLIPIADVTAKDEFFKHQEHQPGRHAGGAPHAAATHRSDSAEQQRLRQGERGAGRLLP